MTIRGLEGVACDCAAVGEGSIGSAGIDVTPSLHSMAPMHACCGMLGLTREIVILLG